MTLAFPPTGFAPPPAAALRAAREDLFAAVPCRAVSGMRPELEGAAPDAPLFDAVNHLWWTQVGALPVLEGEEFVGCFTEDDLVRVCGERLGDEPEPERQVWQEALAGLRVRDAMTAVETLPVARPDEPLLAGLERSAAAADSGVRCRYVFVAPAEEDGGSRLGRIVSFRDVARHVIALHDDEDPAGQFADREARQRARHTVRRALDLPLGAIREHVRFGHEPVTVAAEGSVGDAVRAMWRRHRGYALALHPDGAPLGIFTRRDAVHTLIDPFAAPDRLPLSRVMSCPVRTLTEQGTLLGVFKMMAMEGCRHMPVVDEWDRLQVVVSLWEAVALLAGLNEKSASEGD